MKYLMLLLVLSSSSAVKIPSVTNYDVCGVSTITLQAFGASGKERYNWYSSATGGTPLFTGSKYTIPKISRTTSYWVSIVSEGGTESERVESKVRVNDIPLAPVVKDVQRKGAGMVELTAVGEDLNSDKFNWYSSSTGQAPLFIGSVFKTDVAETTSYWVNRTNPFGCVSVRTKVTATILSN